MRRTPPRTRIALALAALLGGCRADDHGAAKEAERGPEFFAAAQESLDHVQDLVREEVLATCDKWQDRDGGCDEEAVHHDQLECWVDKAAPLQTFVEAQQWRPRRRAWRLVVEVDTCMELRGWRKIHPHDGL